MNEQDYIRLAQSFSPDKSLGQNFLTDETVVEKMVEAGEITRDDSILEIGPGLGILTNEILKSQAKTIFLCEKDPKLSEYLKQTITSNRVKIITEDALILIPSLIAMPPLKVISNLPYNISSPVINTLLTTSKTLPEKIIVMLQKEVAERLSSEPGNRNRGVLTVIVELFAKSRIILDVPKEKFYPVPKVDSAVIELYDIKKPDVDVKKFVKVLKMSFAGKRKKLKNSIFSTLKIDLAQASEIARRGGFSLDDRPEDLTVENWKKLLKELESKF